MNPRPLLRALLACLLFAPLAATAAGVRLFPAPQTLRSDEVTLLWDKPADAGSRVTFEVLRDGQPVGSTTKAHFTVAGLAPEHTYRFAVRSPDGLSNELTLRTPPREPVVLVTDHGAVGDGRTLNTRALQAAIDACPPGGIVRLPAGTFLSGALFLKSDMTLELAEGAVLKGSSRPADYAPFILNRFEGWEMKTYASLLNAGRLDRTGPANVRHLSIRGRGTISGGGPALSDAVRAEFPGVQGLRSRGRLILLMNAASVEIAGVTLEETPCWTLHYIYSEDISLLGLTIRSDVYNGDGIDPDSARNSYIFDCSFDTGDDCIAIKSGKNPEGNVVNRPTENVWISDCRFLRGHGISIGSEMSGGVRGVLVEDSSAGPLLNGLQIKATKDRGGFVEDVTVRHCDLQQITVRTALSYNNDGQPAPTLPVFRNFRFADLDLTKADPAKPAILVNGFDDDAHRTSQVTFERLRLAPGAQIVIDQAADVAFRDLTTGGAAPAYQITRSARVTQ